MSSPAQPLGWYKRSMAKDQSALRLRIKELAHARPRFGYNRIWVLLQREAGQWIGNACVGCTAWRG